MIRHLKRKRLSLVSRFRGPSHRGQALAETALLTVLLFGVGLSLTYFFPDTMNALQIYMDGFYNVLSLPVP
jgi:hypothetical protein